MPAMADPLELYYVPSQYSSGNSGRMYAQRGNNLCGPVSSIQVFIETRGSDFYPALLPKMREAPSHPVGTERISGGPRKLSIRSIYSCQDRRMMASSTPFLFVESDQDFTFDYYFNDTFGLVVDRQRDLWRRTCLPDYGTECLRGRRTADSTQASATANHRTGDLCATRLRTMGLVFTGNAVGASAGKHSQMRASRVPVTPVSRQSIPPRSRRRRW